MKLIQYINFSSCTRSQ